MNQPALPRSTPGAEGVAATGIEAFLDTAESLPDVALHSLMIMRHGRVLAEGWWAPYRPDDVHLLYSVSKSFTATALGFALAEGHLSLGDPIVDHLGDLGEAATDPRVRSMTVDHLVRMATGHAEDTLDRIVALDPEEPVRGFLQLPPESDPGSVFAYNNGATYVLGAILQRITGEPLSEYLQPRLLDPIGIAPPYWQSFGGPREIGFSGLHLTTESIARFAELYRLDGSWQGRSVLPEDWAAEASRVHTPNPQQPNPDWQRGYGYQFWRSKHGYRADGAYGQFGLVLAEQEAVIAMTAETENMQGVLDAVWDHLIPAFAGPADPAADERLAARLHELAVRPETRAVALADDWIRLVAVTEDADGWTATLLADGQRLEVGCGDGRWRRSHVDAGPDRQLVIEAKGRWDGPDTFAAELIFAQTPHRMTVRGTPATGSSAAAWQSVPLPPLTVLGLATPRTP